MKIGNVYTRQDSEKEPSSSVPDRGVTAPGCITDGSMLKSLPTPKSEEEMEVSG